MKRTLKSVLLAAALLAACAGYSQTINVVWQTNIVTLNTNGSVPFLSGPLTDVFDFLAKGSNWIVCPFGTAVQGSGHKYDYGGGLALGYKLNEFVVPTMRLDYLKNQLWMPSASLQLQAPVTLLGKLTVVPFAFTGIATPIGGQGANNGQVVGMFGAGGALRLDFLGKGSFWQKSDLVADYEVWTGGGFNNQPQIRLGWAFKF